MMSPKQMSEERGCPPHFRHTPLQILHFLGNFLRIWSVYSMYRCLYETGASVVLFIFGFLVPSSGLFLVLQKPWKGRRLSNQQIVPSIINGAITALYFILWGKGLKSCGPVRPFFISALLDSVVHSDTRAILMEYSGAVLGVLSAALYGRSSHIWKKVGGLIAMLASFYFLSQGWAMAMHSPFSFKEGHSSEDQTQVALGMKEMIVPILAGISSALRRVIAQRVSLKVQWLIRQFFVVGINLKGDLMPNHHLCSMFSVSCGHVGLNYGCIIIMEVTYKMDFFLPGFIICSLILGFGICEAASLERSKKGSFELSDPSNGTLEEEIQMFTLQT